MFERRVRLLLVLLILSVLGLLARAAQLQVAQAGEWRQVAAEALRRTSTTEATRGRILDAKGRVLAQDIPCNDAAVAYWFVTDPPDEERLYRDIARHIARARTPNYAELSRPEQHELVLACLPDARQKLEDMWNTLARVGGVPREQIDEARRQAVAKVEMRRRQVMVRRYERAQKAHAAQDLSPWWRRWLLGEADRPPELEDFTETIAEEQQAHVILPNLSTEAYNELRKVQDELPGLELVASRTRQYPYANATAHLVGHLGKVTREDLAADPDIGDEQKAYMPQDLIGRAGVEQLAERRLRGIRGRVERDLEAGERRTAYDAVNGQDVQTTIDVDLQAELRNAFENVAFMWPAEQDGRERELVTSPAPGAAVVIDVRTGAIRAMVSYPDFDPNHYERDYETLRIDDVNRGMTNRATQFSAVPGSTIKPIVGLGAVAEGLFGCHETIFCDGYLRLDGKPVLKSHRCWTARMYSGMGLDGHQGYRDPHPTPGLNPGVDPPPGHLTLADALQRSCNVFFETLALRMGEERLVRWFEAFGLGAPTGCGLPEKNGLLLRDMPAGVRGAAEQYRSNIIFAGIGQGYVQATPIQMANVAATLARGGVFVRPTLLREDTASALSQRRDLKLDPAALEMVRRGMRAVVNTPGGSGHSINETLPLEIAAKTGSAQAPPLRVPLRDAATGEPLTDADGRTSLRTLEHSTREWTNPEAPWFRRATPLAEEDPGQSHGWFIGFAPAENPQVAFAVFVEYGGSGGTSAGSVVTQLIDSLVRHGYLEPTRDPAPGAKPGHLLYQVTPAGQ